MFSKFLSILSFSLLLLTLIFTGCGAKDNGVFLFPEGAEDTTSSKQIIKLALSEYSIPEQPNITSLLSVDDLPNNSLYFQLSQVGTSVNFFQLDIYVKNVKDMYDVPLIIQYNPNYLEFGSSSESNGPILGPIMEYRKNFVPNASYLTVAGEEGTTLANGKKEYMFSMNLMSEIGPPYNVYTGKIASMIVNILTPHDFETTLGIDVDQSKLLDKEGNPISVYFFGATIQRVTE